MSIQSSFIVWLTNEKGVYWSGLLRILVVPFLVYFWIVAIWKYNFIFGLMDFIITLILSIIFIVMLDKFLKNRQSKK